jgi:hypothetical protein
LSAANTVSETGGAVFDETVASHDGSDTGKRDQPPCESLPAEKEIFGALGEPAEIQPESEDNNKIA